MTDSTNDKTIVSTIKSARKIVIKIGSNTLAKDDGTTNFEFMQKFALFLLAHR